MRLFFSFFSASIALATALCTSGAFADGYARPSSTDVAPPLMGWTGFYVGAHLGGAWSDIEWANVSLTNERVTNDSSGFFGGAQMGYNQQFGGIVVGVEATLSGGSLGDTFHSVVDPAQTYATDISTIVTVAGRLGVTVGQWMLYAKGGWAGASVDIAGRNTTLNDKFSFDDWRSGWTVGTGFEYKVSRNISLGIEYSFIDLGSENVTGVTRQSVPVFIRDHDVQIQSVSARLNYQFYRDEVRAPMK
jgi:outer membrane immunogenic protein